MATANYSIWLTPKGKATAPSLPSQPHLDAPPNPFLGSAAAAAAARRRPGAAAAGGDSGAACAGARRAPLCAARHPDPGHKGAAGRAAGNGGAPGHGAAGGKKNFWGKNYFGLSSAQYCTHQKMGGRGCTPPSFEPLPSFLCGTARRPQNHRPGAPSVGDKESGVCLPGQAWRGPEGYLAGPYLVT